MAKDQMNVQWVDISSIKPYEKNAKKHPRDQVAHIAASLRRFGWKQPLVVDSDGVIVVGHGRYFAAQNLKRTKVPVVRADDLTEEEIKAYRLADNKTNESTWDDELLDLELDELAELDDIDMSDYGFELSDGGADTLEASDDNYTGTVPDEPKAKVGDLYQLGAHRLLCGDSTDVAVIDRLMDGVKADMVFTDPPFGVNVKGGKDKGNMIMGDLTQTAIPFSFEIAVTKCTKDKAHFYFCGAEANIQLYQKLFDRYLHILPKHLIWVKNGFVMKQNGYHNQFEIIFHGYKQGSGGLWYGGRTEDEASDVWHINRDASSAYLHPTQKPIGVPARAIKNSCPPSGSVVDLFGGSGSTLIACEQLNRKCYMCEIDPRYVSVIIQRYINFKGSDADVFLLKDGKRIPYSEVV